MQDDFEDEDDYAQGEQEQENANLRQLRAKAKKADKLEAEKATIESERDAARRELALHRAGIDLDDPVGRLFAKAYDGEITFEAIRSSAAEYGLVPATDTSPEDAEREQALSRLGSAAKGSQTPSGGSDTITGATYESWSPDVRRRFKTQHPQEFEALKRGESVPRITGF